MKYPCIVFRNGRWYEAGEDVPEKGASSSVEGVSIKVEEVIEVAEEPKAEAPQYTIKEINKMKSDEAKALAIKLGFDEDAVADLPSSEIKRNIITFLKLK